MNKIEKILSGFRNKKVLIIGDVMLDTYVHGTSSKMSPEAPVPIVEVINSESRLGGHQMLQEMFNL